MADITHQSPGTVAPSPMRLGFFGGSFDPPHYGHLAVARAARDAFQLGRVLLAPTARQPLKSHGPEASFADRLRMVELLCSGQPGLEASPIDGPRPGGEPNYTVDTLRRLHSQVEHTPGPAYAPFRHSSYSPRQGSASASSPPGTEIFAILGADAFAGLAQWREPLALLQLAEWIVVSRPGSSLPDPSRLSLNPAQHARIHLLPTLDNPLSATALRSRLRAGDPCLDALPVAVSHLVQHLHLYAAPGFAAS